MERLTFFENGYWWIRLNGDMYGGFPEVDRLAAYEDTGLEPEEIKVILERYYAFRSAISDETGQPMVSWTRAGEICRADKDGRLVVLPCKIGDLVYRIAVRRKYLNHSMETLYIKTVEIKPENAHKYIAEIGKTVFLTREEAEAALKMRWEADNETD